MSHPLQRADPKSVMRLETCLDLFTKKETLDQDERPVSCGGGGGGGGGGDGGGDGVCMYVCACICVCV